MLVVSRKSICIDLQRIADRACTFRLEICAAQLDYALERHLHSELDLPVAVLPNRARSVGLNIHRQVLSRVVGTTRVAVRKVEVWMVERVQHFCVNVHSDALSDRNGLDDRDVSVKQPGALQENHAAQFTGRGRRLNGSPRAEEALW